MNKIQTFLKKTQMIFVDGKPLTEYLIHINEPHIHLQMEDYGKDRLVISKLVLDETPLMFIDEGISCGRGYDVGAPFEEPQNIWERFLKKDDVAFMVQTDGDSMIDAGIESGDTAIFAKREIYNSGDIVLAFINGDALIKYYYECNDSVWLVPANQKYKPRRVEPTDDFYINGVLVQIMKDVKHPKIKLSKLVQDEAKRIPFMKMKKDLPSILTTKRASYQLSILVESGLLDDSWLPVKGVPLWQLGGIADKLSEVLDIEEQWKFFGDLWNKDNAILCSKWAEAKGLNKEIKFTKNILSRLY